MTAPTNNIFCFSFKIHFPKEINKDSFHDSTLIKLLFILINFHRSKNYGTQAEDKSFVLFPFHVSRTCVTHSELMNSVSVGYFVRHTRRGHVHGSRCTMQIGGQIYF